MWGWLFLRQSEGLPTERNSRLLAGILVVVIVVLLALALVSAALAIDDLVNVVGGGLIGFVGLSLGQFAVLDLTVESGFDSGEDGILDRLNINVLALGYIGDRFARC